MIKLSELKSIGLVEYSRLVRENLAKEHFFQHKEYLIVFHCLRMMNFRKLEPTESSVKKYCSKTLRVLMGSLLSQEVKENPVLLYFNHILDLANLPIVHKNTIETGTKKDLFEVQELKHKYQDDTFIKSYPQKHKTPRNHLQRTKLEFYERTLKKEQEILDYMLNNLEDRAIEKAKRIPNYYTKDLLKISKIIEPGKDFPYREIMINKSRWHYGIDFEKLNWEQINPLRNKTEVFPFKGDISKGSSKSFDKEVLTRLEGKDRLLHIRKKIKNLPIVSSRAQILNDLIKLYDQKIWYGFYALALPQIEGIFEEMVRIAFPAKNSKFSLTDKVNAIRPLIENSEYSFDYYEYLLPFQRNKFLHHGSDDKIELKSKYLILDLQHLINSFEEIQSPLIQLNGILKKGLSHFQHIGNYSRFLFLSNQVHTAGQWGLIKKRIDKFVYKYLIPSINFESFLNNLQEDFDIATKKFSSELNMTLMVFQRTDIAIFEIPKKEIRQLLPKIENAIDKLGILFMDDFKLLLDTYFFIDVLPKRFPRMDENIKSQLKAFHFHNSDTLERIQMLNASLSIKTEEDFLLSRKAWKHIGD